MTNDVQDSEVASMLQAARADRFAPGFADRVMARVAARVAGRVEGRTAERGSAPMLRLERSVGGAPRAGGDLGVGGAEHTLDRFDEPGWCARIAAGYAGGRLSTR